MFSNEKHNRMESKPNESNERTRTTESSAAARFQDLAIYPCLPPLYPCILVAGDPHRTEWNRDGAIRRNEKSRKEPCRAAYRIHTATPFYPGNTISLSLVGSPRLWPSRFAGTHPFLRRERESANT